MDIERLEQQLAETKALLERAVAALAPKHWGGGPWKKYRAANAAHKEAERALARAKGQDFAVELEIGCVPELAVPAPLLFQNDNRLIFTFCATRIRPDGSREDAGRAIVKVGSCLATKFGYPNDEAYHGHPLYTRGFSGTAVYEVHNSQWIGEIAEQNRVRFPDSDAKAWGYRHFIFPFHDSSLEILGKNLEVSVTQDSFAVTLKRMTAEIGRVLESAVPGPLLFQDDNRLIFTFGATRVRPDGRREDAGRAIVKVDSCRTTKFGYLNDAAFSGEPLNTRDYKGLAVHEAHNSQWLGEIAELNRVHYPDSDEKSWGYRHFIFPFHDSSLEILGQDLDVSITQDSFEVTLERMTKWIAGETVLEDNDAEQLSQELTFRPIGSEKNWDRMESDLESSNVAQTRRRPPSRLFLPLAWALFIGLIAVLLLVLRSCAT